MKNTGRLRRFAKEVWPLYWLAGYVKYLKFRRALRIANQAHVLEDNPTLPPPHLKYRVHGAFGKSGFMEVGRSIASTLVQSFQAQGVVVHTAAILDFGCGPGRVAVELKKLFPSCHLFGSDIDREAIAWAQEHLVGVADFESNEPCPPTRYASNTFDVIYSISLFTHLDEASQNLWLAEMARVLKPGGTLLTTIHGEFARASCSPEELNALDRTGIVFRVDRKGRFKLDGLPDFYQTTFHTQAYVERAWSVFFEVVAHIQGGLGRHQDLVILRCRL